MYRLEKAFHQVQGQCEPLSLHVKDSKCQDPPETEAVWIHHSQNHPEGCRAFCKCCWARQFLHAGWYLASYSGPLYRWAVPRYWWSLLCRSLTASCSADPHKGEIAEHASLEEQIKEAHSALMLFLRCLLNHFGRSPWWKTCIEPSSLFTLFLLPLPLAPMALLSSSLPNLTISINGAPLPGSPCCHCNLLWLDG